VRDNGLPVSRWKELFLGWMKQRGTGGRQRYSVVRGEAGLKPWHGKPGIDVIVEGIDTRRLPRGKWRSFLLLKCVGTRNVPAAIGQREVLVLQAVSRDGFPDNVIIW
jgi:hypothetical protein